MQILDTKTRHRLYEHYDLSAIDGLETIETSNQYDHIAFSVFDHCLDEKEADENIILHDGKCFKNDPEKRSIYYSYEDTFLKFYNSLYKKYKIFIALKNLEGILIFNEFDSQQEYIDTIRSGIREQLFFCIVIPDLNAIISSNYDFTHWIEIKKNKSNKNHKDIIIEMIKASNLYTLP